MSRVFRIVTLFALAPVFGHDAEAQSFIFTFMANNLAPLNAPDVKFGDLDLDGEMDLLVAGEEDRDFPLAITRAFIGELEEQRPPAGGGMPRWVRDFAQFGFGFSPVWIGAVGWVDIDHNNDLEAFVVGGSKITRPFTPSVGLYDFVGSEWRLRSSEFEALLGGSVEFGDYDNDGDEDLLITGSTEANEPRTLLYAAAGFGTFAPSGVELPGVGVGDGTFADFDGDGDLDILLVGDTGQGFAAYLMENEAGEFTAVTTNLKPVGFASTSWADYDGDGDLDLAISGGTLSGRLVEPETHIYRNDDGVFTDIGADLFGSYYGTVRWGDFDNDGDPDLMEVGAGYVNDRRIGIAYDNQDGTFVRGFSLTGVGMSSSDVGDYDGDGDLDIIIMGEGASVLYRNEAVIAANIDGSPAGHPDPPSGLLSEVDGTSATLSWLPGRDEETPEAGLSYNIRVGSSPNGLDVVTPSANREIGRRLFSRLGNVQNNTSWTLKDLPPGQYFWAVQTLDASYSWSEFSVEASFVIE